MEHIIASGIALPLVAAAAFFTWPRIALKMRRARMLRGAKSIVAKCPSMRVEKWIGVGNVGAVALATLGANWQREFGLIWKGRAPIEGTLVVKIARFAARRSGGTSKKHEELTELAALLDEDAASSQPMSICPLLAIGFIPQGFGDADAVIQVMPMVPGESLLAALRRGRITDRARALAELDRILETVTFFEKHSFYSRNVDSENVIVRPDGKWVRIDYDTVRKVENLPPKRVRRLCRLSAEVLGVVGSGELDKKLAKQFSKLGSGQTKKLFGKPATTELLRSVLSDAAQGIAPK